MPRITTYSTFTAPRRWKSRTIGRISPIMDRHLQSALTTRQGVLLRGIPSGLDNGGRIKPRLWHRPAGPGAFAGNPETVSSVAASIQGPVSAPTLKWAWGLGRRPALGLPISFRLQAVQYQGPAGLIFDCRRKPSPSFTDRRGIAGISTRAPSTISAFRAFRIRFRYSTVVDYSNVSTQILGGEFSYKDAFTQA